MFPVLPKNVHVIMLRWQIVQLPTRDRYEDVCDKWSFTRGSKQKTIIVNYCKLSPLKVVAVAYERWSLMQGFNYRVAYARFQLRKIWYFGKVVTKERWLLTRGGHNGRFDFVIIHQVLKECSSCSVAFHLV